MGIQLTFGFFRRAAERRPDATTLERAPERGLEHGKAAAHRRLERTLGERLGTDVRVTLTNNRRTMISTRREGARVHLRLHRMFLGADGETLDAVAGYLSSRSEEASQRVRRYIEENREHIRPRRPATIRPQGEHHDLGDIFAELNTRHFGGVIDAAVSWGRKPPRRRKRRSIRLGVYDPTAKIIRVHPVLDREWVPRFFVAYILFHEMLHHALTVPPSGGRRVVHGAEFRRREQAYPDYERALEWERTHLPRLLRER